MKTLPKMLLMFVGIVVIISACATVTPTKCHPPLDNASTNPNNESSRTPETSPMPEPPETSDTSHESVPDTSLDNIPDTSVPPNPEPEKETITPPIIEPTPTPKRTIFYYQSLLDAIKAINKNVYTSELTNAAVSVNTETDIPHITITGVCADYQDIVIKRDVHITLQNAIHLSGDAEITIEPNVVVTIDGKNGSITKTSDTNNSAYLFHNYGSLSLTGGYYYVATMSDDAYGIRSEGGSLYLSDATVVVSSTQGRVYAVNSLHDAKLFISRSQLSAESAKGRAITIYRASQSLEIFGEVDIQGSTIIATSKSNGARALSLQYAQCVTLTDNHVTATSHESLYLGGEVYGLHLHSCHEAVINGGTYIAYQTTAGAAEASALESNSYLIANNAAFYGYSSTVSGETYLNNCIFSGCHSGLETRNEKVVIVGGLYESPWHGGIYVCNPETYIYDATLRMTPYSKSLCYQNTKYRPHEVDGTPYEGTYYSCMYVGDPYIEAKAYIDNCTFDGLEYLTTGNAISVSSNYRYLNSACYISNVAIDAYIRVDGLSDTNQIATLYVGANVQYTGIHGAGNVDTETYQEQSFRYSNETRS